MKDRRLFFRILGGLLVGCLVMAWVDGSLRPGYGVKSCIKLLLFSGLAWGLYFRGHPGESAALFRRGPGLKRGLLGGAGVSALILGGYALLAPVLDLSQVAPSLEADLGVTAGNFLWVALYISLVNSLLEEFFFRGFGFLILSRACSTVVASLVSAALFALYHVAMMVGWVAWPVLVLAILGLLAAGLLFNELDRRTGSLWTSWLIHLGANVSINAVGFLLLNDFQ